MDIPGWHFDMVTLDWMHCQNLGVLLITLGNVLEELCAQHYWGHFFGDYMHRRALALKRAWLDFKAWARTLTCPNTTMPNRSDANAQIVSQHRPAASAETRRFGRDPPLRQRPAASAETRFSRDPLQQNPLQQRPASAETRFSKTRFANRAFTT